MSTNLPEERIATDAIWDILDIAGILLAIAGGNVSAEDEILGTNIDFLARVLREKALEAHRIVTDSGNWARVS